MTVGHAAKRLPLTPERIGGRNSGAAMRTGHQARLLWVGLGRWRPAGPQRLAKQPEAEADQGHDEQDAQKHDVIFQITADGEEEPRVRNWIPHTP